MLKAGIIGLGHGTRVLIDAFRLNDIEIYGIAFLSHQVGSFLGSWFGGRLFDYYGSYDLMWWICVILGFVSAAMHIPIIEKPVARLVRMEA